MENCTFIGMGATSSDENANGVLVFGDGVTARPEDKVAVGFSLMGKRIPDEVRELIKNNQPAATWLIRAMADMCSENIRHALRQYAEQNANERIRRW